MALFGLDDGFKFHHLDTTLNFDTYLNTTLQLLDQHSSGGSVAEIHKKIGPQIDQLFELKSDFRHLTVIRKLVDPLPSEETVEEYISGRKKDINDLLNLPKIRVTFEAMHDLISKLSVGDPRPLDTKLFDHFNLGKETQSEKLAKQGVEVTEGMKSNNPYFATENIVLDKLELHRPDVLIFNPAMAYAAWKLSEPVYTKWLQDFLNFTSPDAFRYDNPSKFPVAYWFSSPFIHSQAHAGTDPLTSYRSLKFDALGREMAKKLGWRFFDATTPTSARPEEASDGLHYSRGGNGQWRGSGSMMITQMLLNQVFEGCFSY
eukprot:TRINITY_DN5829_c0_g1_i1.p1 TRINITY_DN5829_c0_g1~~TRINITY_DN5829_c0_g1_i1.p1  ORF type:complete len:317 (-),score=72.67 TRINITY_DN5829_c0_g1_i1:43-993(-)